MKVKIDLLKEHPLNQEIYGEDDSEQFQLLVNRISESGYITPVICNKENVILSGHRRYRAAIQLGYDAIEYEKVNVDPEKELEILLNSNVYREKTTVQKLKEAEYYYQIESRKARERQLSGTTLSLSRDEGRTDTVVADKIGMSRSSLRRAQQVLKKSGEIADQGLKHLLEETLNTDITAAQKLSGKPIDVMQQVNELVDGDVTQVGKVLRNLTNIEIKKTIHLPPGKYTVIYTEYHNQDDFEKYSKIILADIAEPDSVVFLWTLPKLLEQAIKLLRNWGFTYQTSFLWNKDLLNEVSDLGEIMLIGTRGNPPMISLSKENQPMTEKPILVREMIEQVNPRVDKVIIHLGEGWELW